MFSLYRSIILKFFTSGYSKKNKELSQYDQINLSFYYYPFETSSGLLEITKKYEHIFSFLNHKATTLSK